MNEPASAHRPDPARQVSVREAQSDLPRLLDRVAHGEEIVIERDGAAVARLVPPEQPHDRAAAQAAVATARALRATLRAGGVAPFTREEIIALRDAGRR